MAPELIVSSATAIILYLIKRWVTEVSIAEAARREELPFLRE